MTVSNTNKKNTYSGDGATTTFAFTFKVIKSSDVLVKIKDTDGIITTKTAGTHYNVTGTLPGTGNVVFTAGNIPISTDTVILTRDMDFLQETDLVEKDAFPADTVEQQLDQLTMQDLQLLEVSERVVVLDEAVDTGTVSTTLPTPSANKYIRWNDSATALEGVALTTGAGIENVVDDPSPQLGADLDCNGYDVQFDDNTGIADNFGNEILWFQNVGTNTAVNHFEITNSATGASPLLKAVGSDTNVDMRIASQGSSGDVRIESASGITEFVATAATQSEIRLFEDTDNGTNYIGIKPPAAVTSSTTFVLPDGDGAANARLYTDGSGNLNWASTGAFEAKAGGAQSVAHNVTTKVQFPTETYDLKGWYDNATNYRYTPLEAGKYLIAAMVEFNGVGGQSFSSTVIDVYKNGSQAYRSGTNSSVTSASSFPSIAVIVDMNGTTDYVEIYVGQTNSASGSRTLSSLSFFQAIRIG